MPEAKKLSSNVSSLKSGLQEIVNDSVVCVNCT